MSKIFNLFSFNPFYAPEGDTGASGSEGSTGNDAGSGASESDIDDLFESLSDNTNLDDDEDDFDDEEIDDDHSDDDDEDDDKDDSKTDDAEKDDETEKDPQQQRTSKQAPEVDAAYAKARIAEEKAARLEEELAEQKQQTLIEQQQKQQKEKEEADKKTQLEFQSKIEQQWSAHLAFANQMKEAGYDDAVVNNYLQAQKDNIMAQQKLQELEQKFNENVADQKKKEADQKKKEEERLQREQTQAAEQGKMLLLEEHGKLKAQYGDLVPDAKNFGELFQKLDPEIINLISNNGLSLEKAFMLVNHDKILKHGQSLAQKRATANISDRGRKAVEVDKSGAAKPESRMTQGTLKLARAFGIDPKEVAKNMNPKLIKRNKGVS